MSSLLQIGSVGFSLDEPVFQLVLAAVLGLFLGLEREWSEKPAGIRTFSLTSLLGAVFTLVADSVAYGELLVAVGGLLVISQSVLIGVRGLQPPGTQSQVDSLSLTTGVSLLVSYGIGILVAKIGRAHV